MSRAQRTNLAVAREPLISFDPHDGAVKTVTDLPPDHL
jgi:hypothetical protein